MIDNYDTSKATRLAAVHFPVWGDQEATSEAFEVPPDSHLFATFVGSFAENSAALFGVDTSSDGVRWRERDRICAEGLAPQQRRYAFNSAVKFIRFRAQAPRPVVGVLLYKQPRHE